MPDLEIRLLRSFVAVAEELHFSRAARRLYLAQQALSRDIARLETATGVTLLHRTTRRVTLTPAGARLLVHARRLLTLHDDLIRDLHPGQRPVFVDVTAPGTTPAHVVATARDTHPSLEFFLRYHTGLDETLPLLAAGHLDATFARHTATPGLHHRLIRWEPLALLLPDDHPLTGTTHLPFSALRGQQICPSTGDLTGHEWRDTVRQLITAAHATATDDHPHITGPEEIAHHLRQRGVATIVPAGHPTPERTVLRPITDPVPVYPWSLIWREHTPGIDALLDAATALGDAAGWLTPPPGCWMPDPEALTAHPHTPQ